MNTNLLPISIVTKARQDVAHYSAQLRCSSSGNWQRWLIEAWQHTRQDLGLGPREAMRLWPAYWRAFSVETTRIAPTCGRSE